MHVRNNETRAALSMTSYIYMFLDKRFYKRCPSKFMSYLSQHEALSYTFNNTALSRKLSKSLIYEIVFSAGSHSLL